MATITYIPEKTQSKTAMGKVMRYCAREDKTAFELDGRKFQFISGKDCCAETAYREFMATKQQYGKENGMFFYQYVQSFSDKENITPEKAHEIGCKFAEYFKGHEVLIATHLDTDNLHTHFVISSVNFENGLKLQMARGSIHKLRQFSDEICKQYGLSIVQPKEQKSGIKAREYRAAMKGVSWKFKLISAIDNAMKYSRNKAEFIKQMQKMGYQVKWQDNLKHITYTTPDGMKCRDNKLHEEKYLKQSMEVFYEYGNAQSIKSTRTVDRKLSNTATLIRNPAGNFGANTDTAFRDRAGSSAHAGADQQATELGRFNRKPDSGNRQDNGVGQQWDSQVREKPAVGFSKSNGHVEIGNDTDNGKQAERIGENAPNTRHIRLEDTPEMDISGSDVAVAALGAALAIGNLVNQPEEEQEKKKYVPKAERRHKKKKKQSITHDRDREWEMEM